jgi:hypothetical protein
VLRRPHEAVCRHGRSEAPNTRTPAAN